MSSPSFNYPQRSVPSAASQGYHYPQEVAPIGRSSRSGRYQSGHLQRKLSNKLPPVNVKRSTSDFSDKTIARMEDDFVKGEQRRRTSGKDVVFEQVMQFGTDKQGRKKIQAFLAKVNPEIRQEIESQLAEFSGFEMRSDGSLDYCTESTCAIM